MLLMLLPLVLIAQQDSTVVVPPGNWGEVILNFPTWFATFGGVVLLTAFLAAFFNGVLKITKGFLKQLVAWAVAIILMVVSDLANFGYAKEFPLLLAVIHGFAAGLASNGVFNIPFLNGILTEIEKWFQPKPTK